MKRTYFFLKWLFLILLPFFLLFAFRLFYGYWRYPDGEERQREYSQFQFNNNYLNSSPQNFDIGNRNYASKKFKRQKRASSVFVDQKYEKVGALTSTTKQFDEDQKQVRKIIKKFDALVQFEQNLGLAPTRQWDLGIGVVPEKFDEMITAFQKVGKLGFLQIDKKDKTNEYQTLNAKRESLNKAKEALIQLKGRGGKIEDMLKLEDRILEIEKEIQQLGVSLGEYDQENEFCTVKFTLREVGKTTVRKIPFFQRVKVALEWSIPYYLSLMVGLAGAIFFVWFVLKVVNQFKIAQKMIVALIKE